MTSLTNHPRSIEEEDVWDLAFDMKAQEEKKRPKVVFWVVMAVADTMN